MAQYFVTIALILIFIFSEIMVIKIGAQHLCQAIIPGRCILYECRRDCYELYDGFGVCLEKIPSGTGYICCCNYPC
ncbi:unnamed protein product [Amaranthus hypochondriacus]